MSRDDEPRRSRRTRDEEEPRRSRRSREEEEPRSRRRSRDEEDEPKRGKSEDRESVRSKRSSKARNYAYKKMSAEDRQNRKPPRYGGNYPELDNSVELYQMDIKEENKIRFVPQTWSDKPQHYAVRARIHYRVGPAGKERFLCLADMLGKPCPICEERERAIKEGEPKEYIKELYPGTSWFAYVADRKDRKNKKPKLIKMSDTLDDEIVGVSKDDDGSILCIDDPDEGYDVTFEAFKQDKYIKTKSVAVARKPSELESEYLDYAIDNPIPDLFKYYDYELIADVFYGEENSDKKEREKEEDKPSKSKKKQELTYDDVMDMTEDELVDTCVDELGIPEKETYDMTKRQMRKEIVDYFKLDDEPEPEEDSSEDEEHTSRLESMRRRRRE